jgi:hypothetical protein
MAKRISESILVNTVARVNALFPQSTIALLTSGMGPDALDSHRSLARKPEVTSSQGLLARPG